MICVVFCLCLTDVNSLMFHLSPNTKKCLREEIHKDVLVTGDFELSDAPGQKTDLSVSIRTSDYCFSIILHVRSFRHCKLSF